MTTITIKSHVGRDGILKVQVPTELTDVNCQVTMTVQPLSPSNPARTLAEFGWPPGFFDATAGAGKGEPLVREDQGEYEIREPLQ